MFLNVRHVAQTNGVDVEALVEYAKGNNTKFGIVSNGGINCSYIVQYFVHEKMLKTLLTVFATAPSWLLLMLSKNVSKCK